MNSAGVRSTAAVELAQLAAGAISVEEWLDFLIKNLDFLIKNLHYITKHSGGASEPGEDRREGVC